jgi:protein-disulfide isomerase
MSKENPNTGKNILHQNRWELLGLGVLAIGIIALGAYFMTRTRPQTLGAARLAANPALGPENAKVTIVEYGDFGCITCRGWEKAGVRQQIINTYGDQVHFVWKDFPVITAQSPKAAEAGQCAFDQGKFWDYHDLLYAKAPALGVNDLKAYATQIGLDSAKFDQCLDSGKDSPKVDQSWHEAYQFGFQATPSFLINGQKLVGAQPFDVFKAVIDPILAAGG